MPRSIREMASTTRLLTLTLLLLLAFRPSWAQGQQEYQSHLMVQLDEGWS